MEEKDIFLTDEEYYAAMHCQGYSSLMESVAHAQLKKVAKYLAKNEQDYSELLGLKNIKARFVAPNAIKELLKIAGVK